MNHASSASAAQADGRRVPDPRTAHQRVRRMVLAAAVGAGWLGLGIVGVVYIGGLMLQGVGVGLALVPRAIVWLALAAQDGAGWWSIAGRAGGAVAASLASSHVMWWLIGLELMGVLALAGLQRMLGNEMCGRDSEEGKK